MAARETTCNVRTTNAEKDAWRKIAPGGKLSAWLRMLANREVDRENHREHGMAQDHPWLRDG